MKRAALTLLVLAGAFAAALPAMAESDPIYTSWRNNLAIGGYDTVSFYSEQPLKGTAEFSTEYKGAVWHFASRANLDLFRTNPDAFAPQYGGYCAWALANGKLAKGSPKYWHVQDGRLYLNFNGRIEKLWDKDRETFIQDADKNWPEILKY